MPNRSMPWTLSLDSILASHLIRPRSKYQSVDKQPTACFTVLYNDSKRALYQTSRWSSTRHYHLSAWLASEVLRHRWEASTWAKGSGNLPFTVSSSAIFLLNSIKEVKSSTLASLALLWVIGTKFQAYVITFSRYESPHFESRERAYNRWLLHANPGIKKI